jgi:cytochrome c peroxidase
VPKSENLLLHWHIWEPKLTAEENQQIAAFLASLTDQSLTPQLPLQLPSGLPLPAEVRPASTPDNNISQATALATNGEQQQ